MYRFPNQLKRREFLQKGIAGGVIIAAFPNLKTSLKKTMNSSHGSHEKLLKIVQTYGGEFGDARGGL
jgi:hypothetical protein